MKRETIVVTGGSGYIGSEVVTQLIKLQYDVINIDLAPSRVQNKRVYYIKHNLTAEIPLKKIPVKPNYVIHLAAKVGGIAFANLYPATILHDNLLIDLHAITLAKKLGVKRFLYASSSLVYEKNKSLPYKESKRDLPVPSLSYGIAKLIGEKNCEVFQKEYGLHFTICRLFNVYGVNSLLQTDPHSHVIPDLIKKVLSGEYPLSIYGDGSQTRHFTHIKDIAHGIVSVLFHEKAENEIFNIAGASHVNIKEIVRMIWKSTGNSKKIIFRHKKQYADDIEKSIADISKIKKFTGWNPNVAFEDGLVEMINFYKNKKML